MRLLRIIPAIRKRQDYLKELETMILTCDQTAMAHFRLSRDYPSSDFPERIEFQFDRERMITRDPITTRIKSIMPYGTD